jgi:hypothetical protein
VNDCLIEKHILIESVCGDDNEIGDEVVDVESSVDEGKVHLELRLEMKLMEMEEEETQRYQQNI